MNFFSHLPLPEWLNLLSCSPIKAYNMNKSHPICNVQAINKEILVSLNIFLITFATPPYFS